MCKIIACFSGPANVLIPKTPPAHTSFSLNVLQAQNDSTKLCADASHDYTPQKCCRAPSCQTAALALLCRSASRDMDATVSVHTDSTSAAGHSGAQRQRGPCLASEP